MYPYNIPIDMEINVSGEGRPKHPVAPDGKILELILSAWGACKRNARHYGELADLLIFPEDSEILHHMSLDEKKHQKLFSEVYYFVTGERYEKLTPEGKEMSQDIGMNLQECMFDSLKEVELSRAIYFSFLNAAIRDMLYEIITDKQAHAVKLSYLYTKHMAK